MRILFTVSPLAAHLQAMVPALRAAASAGHDVVVATGPDLAPVAQRLGFQTWVVGQAAREGWARLRAIPPPADPDAQRALAVSLLFAQPAVARARDLLPRAVRWAPDLVVHDQTEVAGAEAAALTGARPIVHGTGLPGRRQAAMLAALTAEFAEALHAPNRYDDLVASPYLDPCPPALRDAGALPFADIRPVRPEVAGARPGERLPLRVQRFRHERTVLLTLGGGVARPEFLASVLAGLRACSVNVIVETGPRIDVGALGPAPRDVAITAFISPALALPLCAGVVGHGSPELIVAALSHGLPMVALPTTADEAAHVQRAVATGAVRALPVPRLAPGPARHAVADLLNVPDYAAAAHRVAAEIAALPSAAHALDDLLAPVPA